MDYGENYVVELKKGSFGNGRRTAAGLTCIATVGKSALERKPLQRRGHRHQKKGKTYYMTYSANDTGFEFYGIRIATAPTRSARGRNYDDNLLTMTTDLEVKRASMRLRDQSRSSERRISGETMDRLYHRHTGSHSVRKPSFDRVCASTGLFFDKTVATEDGRPHFDAAKPVP